MLLSPESKHRGGSLRRALSGGRVSMCRGIIEVSPGTWEIPSSPCTRNRGLPGYSNPRQQSDMVSPSEGNEVRRDGRREVLALDSTDEAGEREPTGPRGGKRDVGLKNRC